MQETTTELDVLFPPQVSLTLAGEQFTLEAFKAKNLRPYLAISRRIQDKLTALGQDIAAAHAIGTRYLAAMSAWVASGAGDKPQLPDLAGIPFDLVTSPTFTSDQIPLELVHERCYEEYRDLVAAGTGQPLPWVEDLGLDELITAAGVIRKLNEQRYATKKEPALT